MRIATLTGEMEDNDITKTYFGKLGNFTKHI